jgi:hypothetical protein
MEVGPGGTVRAISSCPSGENREAVGDRVAGNPQGADPPVRARVVDPGLPAPDGHHRAVRAEAHIWLEQRVDDHTHEPRDRHGLAERPPRARVHEVQRAVVVHERERATVRAYVEADQAVAVPAQDADRGRALQQRGEQGAARLRRVLELDALAREQQRVIDVLLGQGHGSEALSVG